MGHTGLLKQKINVQAVFGLVVVAVMAVTTLASTFVSAEALSAMSIVASTASVQADAESVQYTVRFTPEVNAGAFVIDFCNSASGPVLGQDCTGPTAMDVSGAESATGGVTLSVEEDVIDANTLVASKTMVAGIEQEIVFTKITNPTATGVSYARIVTYTNLAGAEGYESDDPDAVAPVIDSGSVAMYFNNDITVSGTVLETLTFCVASVALTPACANAESNLASLRLGDEQGEDSGIFALTTGKIHEKSLFAQINTNAASGAVVRLRSSAACGGLIRAGTDICDIAPAPGPDPEPENAGFDDFDAAYFGVRLGTATSSAASGSTNAVGDLQAAAGSLYDNLKYKIGYVAGGASGVTSTLGDPFLDTAGAPATDQNMELIFGATVTNSTPAGTYSTDLSMIAVGKF